MQIKLIKLLIRVARIIWLNLSTTINDNSQTNNLPIEVLYNDAILYKYLV